MGSFYAQYPFAGGSGGGVPIYATFSAFPAGTSAGQLAVAADTGDLYEWNGSAWQIIAGPGVALSVGTLDSEGSPSANGATITTNQLIMQSASATAPGLVNTTTQTLAGAKTFSSALTLSNSLVVAGISAPSVSSSGQGVIYFDSTSNLFEVSQNTSAYLPLALGSSGDIPITSFSAANNISSATNVTGFAFSNSTVGSFSALVQVFLNATTPLRQTFTLQGTQQGAGGWYLSQTDTGDESHFVFTITAAGQIQYVNNTSYPGFVSATIKFRAETIPL